MPAVMARAVTLVRSTRQLFLAVRDKVGSIHGLLFVNADNKSSSNFLIIRDTYAWLKGAVVYPTFRRYAYVLLAYT